jgi:mono/diheme cytochrome c family protein
MKSCHGTCKWMGILALSALVALSTWVSWDNWGRFLVTPAASTELAHTQPTEQTLAQGKYLAHISGCVACHTTNGKEPLAGGRRIDTPFGAVFSSNLTSSKKHGIGEWTAAEFQQALRWGRSRDGRLLLPVFPYNHTSMLSTQDVQSLFVWLQTVKPVDHVAPEHRLTWPLGTQPIIAIWRSLFFTPTSFQNNVNESTEWNRGAYLVQSAGHCAACHGQRNLLGGFPAVDDLSGGFLPSQMWMAPSLIDADQTSIAKSTNEETAHLLSMGHSPSAHASGPMAEFVQYAGQYMTPADALAMATYLKSRVKSATPTSTYATSSVSSSSQSGQTLYQTHCATCHGENGEGKTNAYPALAGNPAVVLTRPENLIQMTLYGGYGPSTSGNPRPYGMPPYLFTLNNQQIADILTHIRNQWGNHAPMVNPMQVDRVRSASY